MKMVLTMLLLFLVVGSRVERIDRWVITGLLAAISVIVFITYVRF
jgi:hypothetical protein